LKSLDMTEDLRHPTGCLLARGGSFMVAADGRVDGGHCAPT